MGAPINIIARSRYHRVSVRNDTSVGLPSTMSESERLDSTGERLLPVPAKSVATMRGTDIVNAPEPRTLTASST